MSDRNWKDELGESRIKICTRGPVQSRSAYGGIRTRGSIATRGVRPPEVAEQQSLERLLVDLREKANGSPIALVIHRWNRKPAQKFLKAILPGLEEYDSIWLLPDNPGEVQSESEMPGAVILDFDRAVDRKTYENLVADMVFFPEGDTDNVAQWNKRCETLIISTTSSQYTNLVEKAIQNEHVVYGWTESMPGKIEKI